MRLPIKMYLIIFVSASVVLYQYHLSNAWLISQNTNTQDFREINVRNNNNNFIISYNISGKNDTFLYASFNNTIFKCLPHQPPSSSSLNNNNNEELPPLYIITPTYRRAEQLADITRLSHTLMHVPNIYWLVIEDAAVKTKVISDYLKRTNLKYEHIIAPMPEIYKLKKKGPKPRGVSNRNRGLQWIRENAKRGVFYFADDDNTYDLELFNEIRYTKRVSMFPVGLITKLGVSTPIVKNGKFAGFYDGWIANRKFPVDMAGFAINVEFLLQRPKAMMPFKPGYEEDGFLKSLQPFEPHEIELLASNCTKILVWHTQTKKNEPSEPLNLNLYNNTNLIMLKDILV